MNKPNRMESKYSRLAGFTLLELLVGIAIIARLLPALSRAKQKAQGINCANNSREFVLAWIMNAHDAQDKLVANLPGGTTNNSWWGGNTQSPVDATDSALNLNGTSLLT